ncbi:hypothetical protein CEXT_743541 [Caerostris extrusa]|uniref:Uncharacterized protein n=1 Tax=Caerostris extrusa TaxID=172846 RepID=A0AAV4MBK1_CAEEX|nr:hypothetical protein CEXT_743541 [Caerostris extrusa]
MAITKGNALSVVVVPKTGIEKWELKRCNDNGSDLLDLKCEVGGENIKHRKPKHLQSKRHFIAGCSIYQSGYKPPFSQKSFKRIAARSYSEKPQPVKMAITKGNALSNVAVPKTRIEKWELKRCNDNGSD